VYEYLHHPGKAVINMANPAIGAIKEQITGKDWKDQPYFNPDESTIQKFGDHVDHLVKGFGPMSFSKQNQFEGAKEPGATGFFFNHAPSIGLTSSPAYITKPDVLERWQSKRDEDDWQRALQSQKKAAQASGDTAEAKRLREEIRASKRTEREGDAERRRDKARARQAGHPTSQLMDTVGPLIDGAGSRTEMAQKIHAAGYPALAGLIGALPDTLRPQVRARLAAYA